MERKKTSKAKIHRNNVETKTTPKVDWYVLMGFNKENDSETGFLAMNMGRTDYRQKAYKIVHDTRKALKFPSENIYGVNGFGTPKQWLEFFKGEDELSTWKFHLSKIKN